MTYQIKVTITCSDKPSWEHKIYSEAIPQFKAALSIVGLIKNHLELYKTIVDSLKNAEDVNDNQQDND